MADCLRVSSTALMEAGGTGPEDGSTGESAPAESVALSSDSSVAFSVPGSSSDVPRLDRVFCFVAGVGGVQGVDSSSTSSISGN